MSDKPNAFDDNGNPIIMGVSNSVSDKPREFWICDAENDDHETGCFVSYKRLSDEEQDNNGVFNMVHVIEYAAFEKLKAENERLMRERDSYAGYAKLNDELMEERDTLKAKLAEVEAEATSLKDQLAWSIKNENMYKAETHTALINLERMREQLSDCGALYEGAKDTFKELVREREAARVLREALEQIQSLAANEHEQGDSKALDDVLDLTCETFKALAKADEIRGGE